MNKKIISLLSLIFAGLSLTPDDIERFKRLEDGELVQEFRKFEKHDKETLSDILIKRFETFSKMHKDGLAHQYFNTTKVPPLYLALYKAYKLSFDMLDNLLFIHRNGSIEAATEQVEKYLLQLKESAKYESLMHISFLLENIERDKHSPRGHLGKRYALKHLVQGAAIRAPDKLIADVEAII